MGNDQKTRYKLIKQVGAGDYAKVYAAEDVKLGRKVAIKQLHSQYMDDEVKLERYWAEAKLLLELEHPNIMTIYDVVKSRGRLVLELMQGSLKQIYTGQIKVVVSTEVNFFEQAAMVGRFANPVGELYFRQGCWMKAPCAPEFHSPCSQWLPPPTSWPPSPTKASSFDCERVCLSVGPWERMTDWIQANPIRDSTVES